ncbi:hypothetical protein N752_05885 [Desulforamulus aquiferis]|nr:hypothetical protein N752_05885 [Desulforamulus aquiferis]
MNRLDDVLKYPVEAQTDQKIFTDKPEELDKKLEGYLEIRNLNFGYSRLEEPLIRDFNLSLKPGFRVAWWGDREAASPQWQSC